jgi:hypothetical protein
MRNVSIDQGATANQTGRLRRTLYDGKNAAVSLSFDRATDNQQLWLPRQLQTGTVYVARSSMFLLCLQRSLPVASHGSADKQVPRHAMNKPVIGLRLCCRAARITVAWALRSYVRLQAQ